MCYNPQMSCDAIEKHNYGLKLLREIKQVGVIETIDFTLSKWTPNRVPEIARAKRIPADQLRCCIVSFPSLIRTYNPQVFFFFLLMTEAIPEKR